MLFRTKDHLYFRMSFGGALGLSCLISSTDRYSGFWDRSFTAGVSALDMILAQMIVFSVFNVIQLIESVLLVIFVLNFTIHGSAVVLVLLFSFLNLSGLVLGMLASALASDLRVIQLFLYGYSLIIFYMSGEY